MVQESRPEITGEQTHMQPSSDHRHLIMERLLQLGDSWPRDQAALRAQARQIVQDIRGVFPIDQYVPFPWLLIHPRYVDPSTFGSMDLRLI